MSEVHLQANEQELGGSAVIVEKSDAAEGPSSQSAAVLPASDTSGLSKTTGSNSEGTPADPTPDAAGSNDAGPLLSPSWITGGLWTDGVEGVTAKAQELGQNVVDLAATAGKDANVAVNELGNAVSGLGTAFTSLFSVFDGALPHPSDPAQEADNSSADGPSLTNRATAAATSTSSSPPDGQGLGKASRTDIDLQAIFGLSPEENLIEAFDCRLLQLYTCGHNSFTPEIRKTFKGRLFIADKHVCYYIVDSDRRIPITLDLPTIKAVSRQAARKGETGDHIKLLLGEGQWLTFVGFASVQGFESALALLEHVTS